MSGNEAEPLLDAALAEAAWDEDVESRSRITDRCDVQSMFKEHAHDVLKFLQTSGMEKLAEFTAPVSLGSAAAAAVSEEEVSLNTFAKFGTIFCRKMSFLTPLGRSLC